MTIKCLPKKLDRVISSEPKLTDIEKAVLLDFIRSLTADYPRITMSEITEQIIEAKHTIIEARKDKARVM